MHIFDTLKCKSFQGSKVGLGHWLILPCFTRLTPLRYIGKNLEKISGPLLDRILDPLVRCHSKLEILTRHFNIP